MPARPCPKCSSEGKWLEASSEKSKVDYYRCSFCAHVWCLDKENPKLPARDITKPAPQRTDYIF
jgi:hypothetical protein